MKRNNPDWLLAGVLAGAGFLVTFLFVGLGLPVSLVIAGLCLGAGTQLFRREAALPEVPGGVDRAELEASLAEGTRKLDMIRALGKRIEKTARSGAAGTEGGLSAPAKIGALCETVAKILAEIRRDPDDLRRARQFLSYYLDSTIAILEKYETLAATPVRDDKIAASVARADAMLDTIGKAFEKQLANLLSNDVMDLDAELALLENTINMEGLGE